MVTVVLTVKYSPLRQALKQLSCNERTLKLSQYGWVLTTVYDYSGKGKVVHYQKHSYCSYVVFKELFFLLLGVFCGSLYMCLFYIWVVSYEDKSSPAGYTNGFQANGGCFFFRLLENMLTVPVRASRNLARPERKINMNKSLLKVESRVGSNLLIPSWDKTWSCHRQWIEDWLCGLRVLDCLHANGFYFIVALTIMNLIMSL